MKRSIQTLCVSENKDNKSTQPHQLPIYATSSFKMDSLSEAIDLFKGHKSGHTYSRYGNPTIDTVAKKLANLEGFNLSDPITALLTSSGMSAIGSTIYGLLQSGDEILTQSDLYGGTTTLLSDICTRHGITPHFTSFQDLERVEVLLKSRSKIKMIYLETPANPTLACVDIKAISDIALKYGATVVVDNTFCTPYIQRPLELGADIVVHSTTKFLNGHGNSIAGAIIGRVGEQMNTIFKLVKTMGTTSNAWDAWLLNNGLKTLALRMVRQSNNAMKIAKALLDMDKVGLVHYNGLPDNDFYELATRQMSSYGAMLSFTVGDTLEDAANFIDRLDLCTHAPTLGDLDTLVLHPATSSHINVDKAVRMANGIPDNLIRMSVGIESVSDLINDVDQALSQI